MIFYFNQISFEAYITVTWLSGGVCTISNGNVSYTAPNTSGSYTFTVEEEGTYTATVTAGSYTFTGNVSITENGQSKTLAVDCTLKIIDVSPKISIYTPKSFKDRYTTRALASDYQFTQESNGYKLKYSKTDGVALITTDAIDLTPYKTLKITLIPTYMYYADLLELVLMNGTTVSSYATINKSSSKTAKTTSLDVSSINSSFRVGFVSTNTIGTGAIYFTVTKLWLEP